MRSVSDPVYNGDNGRSTTIDHIERAIASRWHLKDKALSINNRKDLINIVSGFRVFRVDSEWIRNNLDVTFGTGGHGLVHLFIPNEQIWIDDMEEPWYEIALHEIVEFYEMLYNELDYSRAHEIANRAELSSTLSESTLESIINKRYPGLNKGALESKRKIRSSKDLVSRVFNNAQF